MPSSKRKTAGKKAGHSTKSKVVTKNTPKKRSLVPPPLGQVWPGQGGVFVGTVYGEDGKRHYHLVVGPELGGRAPWQKAVDWAKGLTVDGHNDFNLPNRREQRFLFCQAKHLHQDAWYWSSEQRAGHSDYAWMQHFGDGFQNRGHEDDEVRARAVRRVPI